MMIIEKTKASWCMDHLAYFFFKKKENHILEGRECAPK
jgi:hypothetical protein